MIYNTRNRNDLTQRKKTCFNAQAGRKLNLTVQCIVNKQIRKVYMLGIKCGQ